MSYGIARDVTTSASPDQVFAVLTDATREADWNDLVTRAHKSFGNGGEGTVFRVRHRLGGRDHPVEMTLQQAHLPWVSLAGMSDALDVTETFTIRPAPGRGTVVSISVVYAYRGWLNSVQRLLERRLECAWDGSAARLQKLLDDSGTAPGIPSPM